MVKAGNSDSGPVHIVMQVPAPRAVNDHLCGAVSVKSRVKNTGRSVPWQSDSQAGNREPLCSWLKLLISR